MVEGLASDVIQGRTLLAFIGSLFEERGNISFRSTNKFIVTDPVLGEQLTFQDGGAKSVTISNCQWPKQTDQCRSKLTDRSFQSTRRYFRWTR